MAENKVLLSEIAPFETETVFGKMMNCKLYCNGNGRERQRFLIVGKRVFKIKFLNEKKHIRQGHHEATLCLTTWWLKNGNAGGHQSRWTQPVLDLWFRDGSYGYLHRLSILTEAEEIDYADLVADCL